MATFAFAGEKALYTFQSGSDCAPYGALISDSAGNLYGTTYGDRSHYGTVFQLTPGSGSWTKNVLHSFAGGVDGRNPVVGLVRDQAGNLYGTAPIGGASSSGVVFQLTPGSGGWTENVIYTFTGGADGAEPYASLVLDQAGNLYGTTSQGGATGNGVVFQLTPGSGGWTESVLYSFTGANDGGWPMAPLVLDQSGNLYGTTTQGGTAGVGVAFKLSPEVGRLRPLASTLTGTLRPQAGNWTETVLYSFTGGNDGGQPQGGLTREQDGSLYSTTQGGGSDQSGVVFKLRPNISALPGASSPWTETSIYSFTGGDDGANPDTGLLLDQAGKLDGTAQTGGGGFGVVFRMTPGSSGWTNSVLYTFTGGADGGFPESTLMQDSAGNLYGTTVAGGQGCGVVYQITP